MALKKGGGTDSAGLVRCKDCGELESFIKQVAAEEMERAAWDNYNDALNRSYGYGNYYPGCGAYDPPTARSAGCGCVGSYESGDDEATGGDDTIDDDVDDDTDYSGTNVQEEGVDEADLIKTDGEYLYYLNGNRLLTFKVWPSEQTEHLSELELEGNPIGIFLYKDWVLALTTLNVYSLKENVWPNRDHSEMCQYILKLTLVDVSNPQYPVVKREIYVEGTHVGSRRIEGSARIVVYKYPTELNLQTWLNPWDYVRYGRLGKEALKKAYEELIEKNKRKIKDIPLDAFLIHYYDIVRAKGTNDITDDVLSSCEDTYMPRNHFGFGILSVITLFFDELTIKQRDISVVAEGSLVYASKENLFVSGDFEIGRNWGRPDRSEIHMFDIHSSPYEAMYLASGWVDGWPLNQFSMSEYDGFFRIATTKWNGEGSDWFEGVHSVLVLERKGDMLEVVGRLDNIAPDERLYAVRFLGKRGFVVTFKTIEQMDPLFTIDLSDPYHPKIVGELEIPGYSTYIHQMGEDHLLTIGENGNWEGDTWGVALSIFDVTDFAHPVLKHHEDVGGWDSYSPAQDDHHAFLYYGELLSIPLIEYDFNGFYVYRATPIAGFEHVGNVDHSDGGEPKRSVVIEDYLYTISSSKLVVTKLDGFENIIELEF